ncbi:FMN-binding protein [Streptomyces sp. NPDC101227]|uniref:FMN-binding protein n=1 Tax=Streptomyces sp. NPDC101227 TaxID=3366136 RepID=UPI0038219388
MRRAVLTTASTSALVVLLLALKPHHSPGPAGGAPATSAAPAPSGTAHRGAGHGQDAGHGNGTYTGAPIAIRYGTVQVAATVKAGRLTAVKVLQAPSENGRDREIAAYALPRLTQEALNTHSAQIDAVSGASYTSAGYTQSLQSALDKAGV